MSGLTRRELLSRSGTSAAFAALPTGPLLGAESARPMKVLVAGAHPDDPESGCGGTIARYTERGDAVTVLYLTRGESGIPGKTHQQAAEIRTAEAEKACAILKAKPLFARQIDGEVQVNAQQYSEFRKLIEADNPDVLFTHWPVDTHPDHRACSLLAYDSWLRLGRKFSLYFFEVDLGGQTQCFRPTHYVDVTATEPRKREACMAHQSQNPATDFYGKYHEPMMRFRGMESGHKLAEAFVHHDQSPTGRLPG